MRHFRILSLSVSLLLMITLSACGAALLTPSAAPDPTLTVSAVTEVPEM